MEEFYKIADVIKKSRYTVVLTGAGISVESGIPPFRGSGGLWEKYRPEIYATFPTAIFTFLLKPEKFVKFAVEFTQTIINAEPNYAHIALAEMEREGFIKSVITQNIDNLHQQAGSKNVIELHGNLYRWFCLKCGRKKVFNKEELRNFIGELSEKRGRREILRIYRKFFSCGCGGRLRPSIVFFGESLPYENFKNAEKEAKRADVFMLIGTSGMVNPAAELPYMARDNGAFIIEINPGESNLRRISDISVMEKAAVSMEKIWKIIQSG
ncbi:MAG TPA: NAD-dependent deacylase [Firmicutes bacterium]|nr:NAD-dependent deacylase [Bacillota bacterium]